MPKNAKGQPKRNDSLTTERRIAMVYQMIVEGYARCQIHRFASDNQWDIAERNVDEYIKRAREMIDAVDIDDKAKLVRNRAVALDHIRAKAHHKGELTTAISAVQESNKLLGLYPEERTRHILDGTLKTEETKAVDWSQVPTERLLKLLEKATDGS